MTQKYYELFGLKKCVSFNLSRNSNNIFCKDIQCHTASVAAIIVIDQEVKLVNILLALVQFTKFNMNTTSLQETRLHILGKFSLNIVISGMPFLSFHCF